MSVSRLQIVHLDGKSKKINQKDIAFHLAQTRPYREEGYCVYNSSGDCLLGYSKYTNSDGMGWPHYIDYCGPSTKT